MCKENSTFIPNILVCLNFENTSMTNLTRLCRYFLKFSQIINFKLNIRTYALICPPQAPFPQPSANSSPRFLLQSSHTLFHFFPKYTLSTAAPVPNLFQAFSWHAFGESWKCARCFYPDGKEWHFQDFLVEWESVSVDLAIQIEMTDGELGQEVGTMKERSTWGLLRVKRVWNMQGIWAFETLELRRLADAS